MLYVHEQTNKLYIQKSKCIDKTLVSILEIFCRKVLQLNVQDNPDTQFNKCTKQQKPTGESE